MKKPIALQAKNIHKSFYTPKKLPILKGIDITVHQGESVAIMGRSGEGKSTLLQILGTLDTPCSGTLSIMRQEVTFFNKSKIRNRNLSFVFQSFHLLEDYSALENILMPAKIGRKETAPGSETYKHAAELLDLVGLSDRASFNTKLLSGGEKQRVAIARALCNNPDIIFADEPSGNLDKVTAQSIHELLLGFARQKNKALIIVTHDESLATLCDTQYVMENGVLVSEIK